MAFVTSPSHTCCLSSTFIPAKTSARSNRVAPLPLPSVCNTRRHAAVMQARGSRPPPPVAIKRMHKQQELNYVYSVWNEVAEAEGLPRVSPDEGDAAESTIHLLAEYIGEEEGGGVEGEKKYVGAARLLFVGDNNVRLDRVCVIPDYRQRGIGRALVNELLSLSNNVGGAIHVNATKGSETGFFSILGFEPVGNDRMEESLGNQVVRTMLLNVPTCAAPTEVGFGCIGLHHTSLRVSDIEVSLAFYGSVGFIVSEKFVTSSGSRACYVEGLGTRLELIECPISGNQGQLAGVGSVQGVPGTGFDRLVFDVTKACTDLDIYLQHLQRRNGGFLKIAGPPAKQVVGNLVVSVASIYDPDGLPIEFIRREAQVPGELRTQVKW